MSERGGWIKIHRKMLEWGWYQDANTMRVFIHLLLLANYGEREFFGHKIMPGQAVITYEGVAKSLKLTPQKVRTALEHLEITHEINRQITSRFQIVTIEKWAFYQLTDEEDNRQITSNQQSNNNQITINQQHYKKERNEEEKNYYSYKDKDINLDKDLREKYSIPSETTINERLAKMRAQIRRANEEL